MIKTFTSAIALAALTTIAASAQAAGPTPAGDVTPVANATPTAPPSASTKYCIVDTVTGSRIAKKVCKTRDAWMREDGFDPLNP
ncbi:hypothetical protein [Sphingomonas pruni]|uniref:hypothetical protein n=1 Tax=Sphingomonas pruni TaxID=40683 RepID=UPI0008340A8C|nr:hypothetical protein [Sphingomonas pruni]